MSCHFVCYNRFYNLYLAALDLSDEDVDGPPVAPLRSAPSKEILVPEENPRTDLKNTLKGKLYYVPLKGTPPSSCATIEIDEPDVKIHKPEVTKNKPDELTDDDFEEICTEAILTHIPEDFCECYESDNMSHDEPFDKDSGLECSSTRPDPVRPVQTEVPDENIGVAQICWRITRHVPTLERPKIQNPPIEKIESYPSLPRQSIDYDPVLYHCENFEHEESSESHEMIETDDFEFSQVDVVNFRPLDLDTQDDLENGLEEYDLGCNDFTDEESTILDDPSVIHQGYSDEDEFCTVEVDESVMEEPSQLYTKPYINLKIDWM